MFWTHLVFGFLLGTLGILYFRPENQILFMILALTGSALPDIDHPRSRLGRKTGIIGLLFQHRGFFHSLFMLLAIAIAGTLISEGIYIYALVIGFGSHLLIDSITREGIMPLHPLSRIRLRGPIYTGKKLEWIIFAGLMVSSFLAVLKI